MLRAIFDRVARWREMTCVSKYRTLLSPYVDGELDATLRARVEMHLRHCARCSAEHGQLLFASRLVGQLQIPEATATPFPLWLKEQSPAAASTSGGTFRKKLLPVTAVSVLLLASTVIVWYFSRPARASWEVTRLTGSPTIEKAEIARVAQIQVGQWLETDGSSSARLRIANIGHVEIEPDTAVSILDARTNNYRLVLKRGQLHASILAPPRIFFVETPAATAVDYGCSYTLEVDDAGDSLLRVTAGWVGLMLKGRESLVPAGSVCRARLGKGPGTPYLEDASTPFREALDRFDFEDGGSAALDVLLDEARVKDSLTLWHLLSRGGRTDRERIYARLTALVPPPANVTREGVVLYLDRHMLEDWRERIEYASVGVNSAAIPSDTGSVQPTGAMNAARYAHTATLLNDNRVLVAGGLEKQGSSLASAELYNPQTGLFTNTAPMSVRRVGHTATLLRNGRVLVTGGSEESFYNGALASAELYDPPSNSFVPVGNMHRARLAHRATLLADGKVLITGGQDEKGNKLSSTELFDPESGTFVPNGDMGTPRADHTATLLRSGHVLVAGGAVSELPFEQPVASAEIYNPTTGGFTPTGTMSVVRFKHSATLLSDGRVLIVGGADSRYWEGMYASAEIYDPARGEFSQTSHMSTARYKIRDAVVPLQNGKILVAGGGARLEIFDPATSIFGSVKGSVGTARYYSTATPLPSGEVLITGGYISSDHQGAYADVSAWVYRP